jgi:hypothetical protein
MSYKQFISLSKQKSLNEIPEVNFIDSSSNKNQKKLFLSADENGREIWISKIIKARLIGDNIIYPNTLIYSRYDDFVYRPYENEVMSLSTAENQSNRKEDIKFYSETTSTYDDPLFFFIYNTDNYYHFIYDTLPHLICFHELKKTKPKLKLLTTGPNLQKKDEHYPFVLEFLNLMGINYKDLVFACKTTEYSEIYFSTSFTHDSKSNFPPRSEVYSLFHELTERALFNFPNDNFEDFNKIYISRRTDAHRDFSNIGTNYTTKRSLTNEVDVVDFFVVNGFKEIFTESLSTIEKISLFAKTKFVAGPIGGGLCNILFSPNETRLLCINSPGFFDVNARFKYSFFPKDVTYFDQTDHVESGVFKKYMRVKHNSMGFIGEILEVRNDKLFVGFVYTNVAGWNADLTLNKIWVNSSDCTPLDKGLNSAWLCPVENLVSSYNKFMS